MQIRLGFSKKAVPRNSRLHNSLLRRRNHRDTLIADLIFLVFRTCLQRAKKNNNRKKASERFLLLRCCRGKLHFEIPRGNKFQTPSCSFCAGGRTAASFSLSFFLHIYLYVLSFLLFFSFFYSTAAFMPRRFQSNCDSSLIIQATRPCGPPGLSSYLGSWKILAYQFTNKLKYEFMFIFQFSVEFLNKKIVFLQLHPVFFHYPILKRFHNSN